ncbi:MAG TPA: anthranilate synthase component I [Chthoniobacterales bacterium]|jgi:anthranilate synthase component 1
MSALPLLPSYEDFLAKTQQGNLIPVYTELVTDFETPVSAFQKIDTGENTFLLESAETNDHVGRYSFLGSNPAVVFESRDLEVRIVENGAERVITTNSDPLAELEKLMARYRPVREPALPAFTGGAVGFLTFDAVRFFEPSVGPAPKDDLGLPETKFLITDTLLAFDHRRRKLQIIANAYLPEGTDPRTAYDAAGARIAAIIEKLRQPVAFEPLNTLQPTDPVTPTCNTTREEYLATVSQVQEYIHAGDIFQIVPSQRFEIPFAGEPLDFYRSLRSVNPSPYLFCFRFSPTFALVGSSPEVHVRLTGDTVEIRPIAGTRRRGENATEDDANAAELLADRKERAEHLMLVDLARNDVGRIAEYGSVRVTDFMTIERYSHVMHIVSNVVGTLRGDRSSYEVMRATFPAGTVSGSPKVRAMQIINQVEKNKRGIYSGAVGYFGFDGALDSCIALRTAVLKDGKAYVQAGGGVVADSTPEGEYQETVNKAMGLMKAFSRAQQLTKS